MKINRIKKDKDFVILSTNALKNSKLSWGAKGLHSFIMQLPDEWELNVEGLKAFSTVGRDGTASLIKELMAAGYIQRKKVKNERNQFLGYEYDIYETPQAVNAITENGISVNGKTVNGNAENGKSVTMKYEDNTIVLSNKELNNEELSGDFEKSPEQTPKKSKSNNSVFDPSKQTKPENLDAEVFERLQMFVTERINRKTKGDKVTDGAWGLMIGQAMKALQKFEKADILQHIEAGIVSGWKSPFFGGWEEVVSRAVKSKPSTPPPPPIEDPFQDEKQETSYMNLLNFVKKYNPNFHVSRGQFTILYEKYKYDLASTAITRMIKTKVPEFSTRQTIFEPLLQELTRMYNKSMEGC